MSNALCSVDPSSSTLTATSAGYDVSVRVIFTPQFNTTFPSPNGAHQIWALGENAEGLASPWVGLGNFVQLPGDGGPPPPTAISPGTTNISSTGGNSTVNISTSGSWVATFDSSWVVVQSTSGNGSATLPYTVATNSTGSHGWAEYTSTIRSSVLTRLRLGNHLRPGRLTLPRPPRSTLDPYQLIATST